MAKEKIPSPVEIGKVVSTEQSKQIVGDIESTSCTLVKLRAYYLDKWETPMAGALFNLYINDKKVLSDAKLKGYKPNPKEAGTYVYDADETGTVLFEITSKQKEALLQKLKEELVADFKEPYKDLHDAMLPYNLAWENNNHAIEILKAANQGKNDAIDNVTESFIDLFSEKFWTELKAGAKNVLNSAEQSVAEQVKETLSYIKEVEERGIYGNAEVFLKWNKEVYEEVLDMPKEIEKELKALGRSMNDAQVLANNANRIFNLPNLMLEGKVDEVEQFISDVLCKLSCYENDVIELNIKGETIKTLKFLHEDGDWQTTIELIYDHEALGVILTYMNKFYDEIPPNFIVEKSTTLGGIIMLEIAIGIILGILTGGAGTAARLALVAGRVSNVARRGGNTAEAASALKAFSTYITVFGQSLEKLNKVAKKLMESRQGGSKNGIVGDETKHTKKEEPKSKCSIGSNNKGNFTYDDEEIFN